MLASCHVNVSSAIAVLPADGAYVSAVWDGIAAAEAAAAAAAATSSAHLYFCNCWATQSYDLPGPPEGLHTCCQKHSQRHTQASMHTSPSDVLQWLLWSAPHMVVTPGAEAAAFNPEQRVKIARDVLDFDYKVAFSGCVLSPAFPFLG